MHFGLVLVLVWLSTFRVGATRYLMKETAFRIIRFMVYWLMQGIIFG